MHFHTAAYCIFNHFNLSPSLETPKLKEQKVFPPPLADIYVLSCFCSPKTLDEGQSNAELQSPRSRGAGGQVKAQFGLPGPVWPSRGVVSVLPCQSCSSPSTSGTLAQHPGRWGGRAGPAAARSRAQEEFAATLRELCQGEATAPGLAVPSCPWDSLSSHPSSPGDAHCWDLPQVMQCPKCSALHRHRWGTSGLGCARDKGSELEFSVPSVGREQERWSMDVLIL